MANNKSTKLNQRISQMKADSQKKKKQFEQIVSNAKRENERISASTRQAGQKITTYMSSPSVKRGGVTYLKEPTSIREKFFGDTDKPWYTGKNPTQSQTVARMYTVANGDEQKFRELEAKYNAEIRSAGSPIYAPYVEATNTKAIDALTELGYDMSGGVNQKWLDDNKWLLQYGRQTTTSYGPSAPTKKSTALENAAYWYNVLLEDEEATVAAETEYKALADNVKYLVERGYSDEAILKQIKNESFGSTYRTLAKMDEERSLGSAVRLNRSVNYNGDDTIYGMIWAARNGGGSGDYFVDAVKYALGEGNKYVADPKSEAARDPSSPDYHPYYGGSTLHEINMRYGVTSYDDKWFVDNAWMKNGTQQERNDYLDALDAKDNADAAMRELSGEDSFGTLDGWVQRKVDSGMSADEIIDLFDAELNSGDYPTLAKMERLRQRGTYLPLAYEVNFTVPVYEQKIRDMVAERDQAAAAAEAEVKQQEENKQREREERVEAALAGGSAFLSGGMGADGPIDMGQLKQPEEMLPEEEPSAEPEVTPEPTRPAYESSMAYKSVFGTTEEQPREGMADGEFVPQSGMDIGEPTPLSTSTGKMTADSEEGQAYLSMLNGGEWDSAVFSEALASSTNRAGMLDEVEQDILALRSGKPMDQVSGIARSWYNAHAHLLDYDIKGIDYSRNIGVVDDSLDIAQYYGDTLDEIIRLNAEAANVSAITPEKYIENLMQIADVTDIVDGIAARDGEGKEVAAQQVLENIPGQQETLDAIYDSCTEAIEANAAALEEANQQALQASIDAVKAYQAGTASEMQQMFMDNAMAMDSSAVAKNDAAYKEAEAYISNALSPDGLRSRGIMFTTGSAEADMAMDPEMLFNTGAQAYAQGVKGIADAKLQRDLKLATVCGMSLAEYYEAFPEEARTADQILAEAENEYKAAWQDEFGGTIKGLLEMNEAEDEVKEGLGLRESVFGMPAQKFDAMTAASMWKTIDLLFYKGLTGDAAMGAMYREYGGDRAVATASVTEYIESLPEDHQQRKELEAFLGSGADIFSLGKTTGQLKTEAGVINAEADLQTIEKFVSEHGTALEKSMVDITASSMNSIAQMGAAAVGVANGLPNWLASVVAAIPEGGSTGYDLNRQGASYGTSILAAFGQTLWTGLTESFMNTEYLNLGNSPVVQKAKKILGQYELSAMLHGDPGTGAKIMNFFLDAVAASPAEGAQEFFQSLGGSVIENIALNLNGLRKGFVLGKDDLSDAGQEFLMGMVTSLPLSGVGAGIESFTSVTPKLTDARGNLLSLAEAQLLPEYDGALINSAIDSEVTREAIYEASADLQAIAGSNEQAAVAQAQEEARAAMLEAEEAQQEADRLDAEMTARQQALESINQQMLETDEFNQDMHDQMTALAESILNESTALTDAQVKAEEASRKADEAQQKVADAEAVVQEMYDRAMDDAKRRVRPRVVERMYAGVSEDAQTAEQAYLDACARLSDAKNELRSAKADLDVYQRGTARGQEARSAYNEAMKEVERLTEEVETAKRAVDEAYTKTPEAQAEVMLEEDVSAAETAAQEAEAAAEADPGNLQAKAKAGIARAKATAEAALKNLENVRQKVQSMITSADRNVRAQAAADYQAAVQEAEAAQKAVDDAQSEYDSEYSAQGKLQKAIDNFKQYSNEDLLLEENENHEAAVKAYAELEQASLAVELENAYAKMDEAAANISADDTGTIRAFKEAQEGVRAAEASVAESASDLRYLRGDGWKDYRTPGKNGETTTADKNPIEILSDLTRSIKVGYSPSGPMNAGRKRVPSNVMALYNPKAKGIRVRSRNAGDLAVGLHEFGHATQDRLPSLHATSAMIDALPQGVKDSYTGRELDREAVAKFVVDYMYNRDEAVSMAGETFVRDFERMLRTDDALNAAISNARNQVILWNNSDPASKVDAMIKDATEAQKRDKSKTDAWYKRVRTNVFDSNNPLHKLGQKVYDMGRWSKWAANRADVLMEQNLIDMDGNIVGKSVNQQLADIGWNPEMESDTVRYMVARNALSRLEEKKPAFAESEISRDDLEQIVRDVKNNNPKAADAADVFVDFWWFMTDNWLVPSGLMTQETHDKLWEKYPYYVPLNRVVDVNWSKKDIEAGTFKIHGIKQGGSSLEIINPIQNLIAKTQSAVRSVARNQMMQAIDEAVQQGGFEDLIKEIPADMAVTKIDTDELEAAMRAAFDSASDLNSDAVSRAFDLLTDMDEQWRSLNQSLKPNVIAGRRADGTMFFYQVQQGNEDLYKALTYSPKAAEGVLRLWKKVNNAFTQVVTQKNPQFALSNAISDFWTSVNTGSWASNYLTGAAKWAAGFYDVVTNAKGVQGFKAAGGGSHSGYSINTDKGLAQIRRDVLGNKDAIPVRALKGGLKFITAADLNDAIELTSRYVEYKYGKHDKSTAEGRRKAVIASQDVTVDFSMSGANDTVREILQCIPFGNATVQGLNKTLTMLQNLGSGDSYTRNRAVVSLTKTVVNTGITAAVQAYVLGALFGDDDDEEAREAYARLNDEVKAGNLILPLDRESTDAAGYDRPYLRIPLAKDALSRAVYAFALDMFGKVSDMDELSIDMLDVAKSLVTDSLPGQTLSSSVTAALNNKTWYGGQIVSDYMLDSRSPINQTKEDTPAVFRTLAIMATNAVRTVNPDFEGFSPAILAYIFEQNTGYFGKVIMPLVSKGRYDDEWTARGALKNLVYTMSKRFTIDPNVSNSLSADFNNAYSMLEKITAEAKAGLPIDRLGFSLTEEERDRAVNDADRLLKGPMTRAKKEINSLWNEIDIISQSKRLTDSEKAIQIMEVRAEQARIYEEAQLEWGEYVQNYVECDPIITRFVSLFKSKPELN